MSPSLLPNPALRASEEAQPLGSVRWHRRTTRGPSSLLASVSFLDSHITAVPPAPPWGLGLDTQFFPFNSSFSKNQSIRKVPMSVLSRHAEF